jgi:hypothetical protein
MANEVSYASLLSAGGRVARILSSLLHTNLYDPTGLRALMTFIPYSPMGSSTMNVTKVTRGSVMAAATTELSSGFANTALSTGNYDLAVARYGLKMQPTDLMKITGGALDVNYVVGVLTESLDLTLTDLLTALFSNIAGNVGTTTVDLTVDDFFDAVYYLNLANNPGQLSVVLHNQQINDLIESIRGEAGPMQFRTDAQGLLTSPGVGFRGQFAGVAVYQSDSCALVNSSADRQGCMFSAGAFAYTLAPVAALDPMINPADILVATPEMFVERVRDGANGMTSLIANAYPGTAEAEDLRACRVTTDA